MTVQRISPEEARRKAHAGEAMLVCAYDSSEKFRLNHLEDAWSLEAFRARLKDLPRDREIIFFCA